MKKVLRFLGIKGRTTIPLAIRYELGLKTGDIISFNQDGGKIILQKEKLCNNCRVDENSDIAGFIDNLSAKEQRDALLHLSQKFAQIA